jgi:hypothetical protein
MVWERRSTETNHCTVELCFPRIGCDHDPPVTIDVVIAVPSLSENPAGHLTNPGGGRQVDDALPGPAPRPSVFVQTPCPCRLLSLAGHSMALHCMIMAFEGVLRACIQRRVSPLHMSLLDTSCSWLELDAHVARHQSSPLSLCHALISDRTEADTLAEVTCRTCRSTTVICLTIFIFRLKYLSNFRLLYRPRPFCIYYLRA